MANIDAEIKQQGNNDAWFTTNAAVVYSANIVIYHIDGRYKFSDGVTALSSLPFLAGATAPTAATIAAINHGTSAKTTLVDADEVTGQDSANSFSLIRTTWANVKVFLKTYFDTIYTTTAAVASQITTALTNYVTLTGTETLTNKTLTNAIVGTQSPNDNSTKAASTAYVDAATPADFDYVLMNSFRQQFNY